MAGVGMVAGMYLLASAGLVEPLPQLLQRALLGAVPGPVFGFLIDRLQHLGKVIEEAGLVVAIVAGFAGLGAGYGLASARIGPVRSALAWALGGWLLLGLVVLPLSGAGLLGLAGGPSAAVGWALLFFLYGATLAAARAPCELNVADAGRRRLLGVLPLVVGMAGLGFLAWRFWPAWYESVAAPPEAGLGYVTPEVTPPNRFFVVSQSFTDPVISRQQWKLAVAGLVQSPQGFDYDHLLSMPQLTEYVTIECVSNLVGGRLLSTAAFTGVPLRALVAAAEPQAGARFVLFRARDGYSEFLPLDEVMGRPDILVAHKLGGEPLTAKHGFPARVVVPGRYGMKGPKWLDEIRLAASPAGGFWEAEGWDREAIVRTTARFDTPVTGAVFRLGGVELAGVAFAGTRGISGVEFTTNPGQNWSPGRILPSLSPATWVRWRAAWVPPRPGSYSLQVRARDGHGDLQIAALVGSFPSGSTGYHTVDVQVIA